MCPILYLLYKTGPKIRCLFFLIYGLVRGPKYFSTLWPGLNQVYRVTPQVCKPERPKKQSSVNSDLLDLQKEMGQTRTHRRQQIHKTNP